MFSKLIKYLAIGLFIIILSLNLYGYCAQFSNPLVNFITLGGFIAFFGWVTIKT